MKYIEKYLEEEMNIHPIGEVTFVECSAGEEIGYTLVIGGKRTTLDVWWSDYATWLEKKLDEKIEAEKFSEEEIK